MRIRRLIASGAAAGALVAAAVVAGDAAYGSPAGTWVLTPLDLPGSSVHAIRAVPGGAWAVGSIDDGPRTATRSLVMRWADGRWNAVPTPDVGQLDGIDGTAPSDLWAVGRNGSLHWDGSWWQAVPVATSPEEYDYLLSVTAPASDDAWAVGTAQARSNKYYHGLLEHWDGKAWSRVALPPKLHNFLLDAVAGTGPRDVWAAGAYLTPDRAGSPALLMHYAGDEWETVPAPRISGNAALVQALLPLAPDDVFAAGGMVGTSDGIRRPFMLHYDGRAWSRMQLPPSFDGADIESLAVGNGVPVAAGELQGLLTYAQGAWRDIPGPELPANIDHWIHALSATPTGLLWAVGGYSVSFEETAQFVASYG